MLVLVDQVLPFMRFDMATVRLKVNEDVLWLQVSINDIERVEVLKH